MYSFDEACEKLEMNEAKMGVALFWLKEDDARILELYGHQSFSRDRSFEILAWFRRNTRMGTFGQSLFDMMNSIGRAQSLQKEVEEPWTVFGNRSGNSTN